MTPIDARRVGFYGKKSRTPVTQTFNTSGTWVAPATTTMVDALSGRGSNGTSSSVVGSSAITVYVFYNTSGSGGTAGNYGWPSANTLLDSTKSSINAGGNLTYTEYQIFQYSNNTYRVETFTRSLSGVIGSSAGSYGAGGWTPFGNISAGGEGVVTWNHTGPPTNGDPSTALGKTFPGGTGGPAPTTNFTSVAVTPGTSYDIVVPPGGTITFSYYQ
ncbi:hypothetical protein F2P44_31605 [Massilia sp. CCM 8695]|uniref:Uncharacterized protein n=1 Tax=Massilia frigida TaxID=2609281 RepID=A0ABX0NJV8_9BURK|nr:hypothetical protein [Massilia frigida]NHZ83780.1 hypothetical protein [Massilia frigida]